MSPTVYKLPLGPWTFKVVLLHGNFNRKLAPKNLVFSWLVWKITYLPATTLFGGQVKDVVFVYFPVNHQLVTFSWMAFLFHWLYEGVVAGKSPASLKSFTKFFLSMQLSQRMLVIIWPDYGFFWITLSIFSQLVNKWSGFNGVLKRGSEVCHFKVTATSIKCDFPTEETS